MIDRDDIWDAIARHGYWLYEIRGGPAPDWRYTIGLDTELVLCGSTLLSPDALTEALGHLVDGARGAGAPLRAGSVLDAGDLGSVALRAVHPSWSEHLLLGAIDYYAGREFEALQLVPPVRFADCPDLSEPYDPDREPAWRWLTEPWPYSLPAETMAFTDTSALAGLPITVVNHHRAEDSDGVPWELFATQAELTADNLKLAPLGTLIALDPTLAEVLELGPGEWAEREGTTVPWDAYFMP